MIYAVSKNYSNFIRVWNPDREDIEISVSKIDGNYQIKGYAKKNGVSKMYPYNPLSGFEGKGSAPQKLNNIVSELLKIENTKSADIIEAQKAFGKIRKITKSFFD